MNLLMILFLLSLHNKNIIHMRKRKSARR